MNIFQNRGNNKRLLGTILICTFSCLVTPPVRAQLVKEKANCRDYSPELTPKFKVVRRTDAKAKSSLQLFITVSAKDGTRDRLIALSCELAKEYATKDSVYVWIFNNKRAAKVFRPLRNGNDYATDRAYLGMYGFSRVPESFFDSSLTWEPDPGSLREVYIDLGPPPQRQN